MNYKNNKKGFTLIELLAVIVILAIIALIATPIIMNVIIDAKKGAAKDSMYAYVKAVELATAKILEPDTDLLSGPYQTKDGNLVSGSTLILTVDLKGTKPSNNSGDITLDKGLVIKADLKFDGYCIGYDGEKAINKDDCTVTPPSPSIAYVEGTVIYYNPETNKKCTASELNTAIEAKTGCLKWNVITMGDTTSSSSIDIMLDHNSTGHAAWITKEDYIAAGGTADDFGDSGNNNKGPITANKQLQVDVTTWNASIKSSARLITGQEIANIGKDAAWKPDGYSRTKYPTQPWLYGNLSEENTIEKPWGYWTSTANLLDLRLGWGMFCEGFLTEASSGSVFNEYGNGIRPVIRVLKSNI